MGSATQIRVLGGTIGLAICSVLLRSYVTSRTSELLTPDQQAAMLQSFQTVGRLAPELQVRIREVYADGYSQVMRVMLYFCIASLLSLLLLFERNPRRLQTSEDGEIVVREEERAAVKRS